jgi:hypothetical protein
MAPDRTQHGQQQHQRRATPGLFECLLLDHGTRTRSHGADLVFLDKAARKRIRSAVGGDRGLRVFERYMHANSYLIVADDGRIVTTGYRTNHVKRH